MDTLKLLSRSTGLRKSRQQAQHTTPSSGQPTQPQVLRRVEHVAKPSKKRKRGDHGPSSLDDGLGGLDFFGDAANASSKPAKSPKNDGAEDGDNLEQDQTVSSVEHVVQTPTDEEVRATLKQHKLKVTWLNPMTSQAGPKRKAGNLDDQGYTAPTEVQMGALPLLLDALDRYLDSHGEDSKPVGNMNLLTVAPTGSGKTLAFMIPLLHRVQTRRHGNEAANMNTVSAIVLAPTKELVSQITNEGRKLAKGTGIKVTQMRRGMRLATSQAANGTTDSATVGQDLTVKVDVLISTPGLLHSMLGEEQSSANDSLCNVRDLVLDEADVLLDPLFREQTLGVWNRLSNSKLSVSLWSATMGSNIEELAASTIRDWRSNLSSSDAEAEPEAPFIRLVVGLKDSAVPNVEHRLVYAATEQGKLMGLRQLLHPASTPQGSGTPLLPPFLIFTQTIERAVALHSELLYDIPAEAGGISRIAVLHADLSDTARDSVMTRFRKGEIWVLITTDLLSRGVDFRGVNGVVNYDIPTSSAAYVHRVGRTGRAGREGGVAVTLYSKEDIPYLKHVANVVAMAQKQEGSSSKDSGLQQWLLDALPKLSKQEKQKLKKRGIESRTTRGKDDDPKAARRTRISSKPGFVRQAENNRKGAVLGSQRRAQAEAEAPSEAGDDSDFAGFD
ncbi:RNA-dependent ATPase rok1 [Elasticomyces elasticus]|nr:RNA-dependent ATPase rok1 [Elasticomyces elasticus]KAK3635195.1 RNA-dependent ATPase rok1 [Elasticomyces elasticus]KAK4911497.1 RNA-dependent ATPase rok1 [Elasticomyces elasticus]KAK5751081.1 RNA-dependent ATPase rok1 [Elasticomyces elasticus]